MRKTIVIGLVIALALVITFASVDAKPFEKKFCQKQIPFKTFGKAKINLLAKFCTTARHVISVNDPSDYNETDLLNFAEQGIDIHNWATWFGGKATPFRYPNGSFYLSEGQKQLIIDLYDEGQTIFWIGVTTDHIVFIFGNPYEDTTNAIKTYTNFFMEEELTFAKVGLYVPIWHDEILTRLREGMTWPEQYELVEIARVEIMSRLDLDERARVKWTVAGQDFMIHDEIEYQLKNDEQSYWMHHTDVTTPEEAEDLVYHNVFSVMADEEWKAIWSDWGKFAWTDGTLVNGDKGNRELTELGEQIFE